MTRSTSAVRRLVKESEKRLRKIDADSEPFVYGFLFGLIHELKAAIAEDARATTKQTTKAKARKKTT